MYIISGNLWGSMAFGIIWGFLIFKLNRFIVNTKYSDGKAGLKKFSAGLPRIILTILLGIVIAIPWELRIFKDEIKVKIEEMKQEESRDNNSFQTHLAAFSKMKKENEFINLCSILIMLLFIILETAPISFKMMSPSGAYEDLLNAETEK